MARKIFQYLTVLALVLAAPCLSRAQVQSLPDTTLKGLNIPPAQLDSLAKADSLKTARADSLEMLQKSSLERPAFSTAKDSIITDFRNGRRMIYYYGGATVTYQNMKLTADYLEYNMLTNTVYARGQMDPTTGEMTGLPEMTEGGQTYKMDELRFNFTTQKARITNMVTKES